MEAMLKILRYLDGWKEIRDINGWIERWKKEDRNRYIDGWQEGRKAYLNGWRKERMNLWMDG